MMITLNCLYCNREIDIFENGYDNTEQLTFCHYLIQQQKKQSEKCKCHSIQIGMSVFMQDVLKRYREFKVIHILKDKSGTFIIGRSEEGVIWYNTLDKIKFNGE